MKNPAVQLADLMTEARAEGCEFFYAWVRSLDGIDWSEVSRRERSEWLGALTDGAVISGWHAAYEGFADPRGQSCAELDVLSMVRTSARLDEDRAPSTPRGTTLPERPAGFEFNPLGRL